MEENTTPNPTGGQKAGIEVVIPHGGLDQCDECGGDLWLLIHPHADETCLWCARDWLKEVIA